MGMKRTLVALGLVLVLVVSSACGNDDDGDDAVGSDGPRPEPACILETEDRLPEYEGLSEQEANDLAAEQGLDVREVGRDGECFMITMDLRDDRVNLEYVDDVVIAAAIF